MKPHFLIKFILISCLSMQNAQARDDESRYMKPQTPPFSGPWFEGWYIRVVDQEKKLSFATISTTSTHEKIPLELNQVLPGYKAFVFAPEDSALTYSREEFPQETQLVTDSSSDALLWQDSVGSSLTSDRLDLVMPESSHRIEVNFGEHTPWSKKNIDWGPAGLAGQIPILPLQWFVVSTKTPVSYKLTTPQGVLEGTGYAHIEKNWGKAFPKAWMWLQGLSDDGEHQLAIAGGPLKLGPATITAFLVGVRGPNVRVDIQPSQGPQVKYKTWSEPCAGKFKLRAKNWRYKVEVTASAPIDSFVPLAIPTKNGYLPNLAQESFYSTINVKVWEFGRLAYEHEFTSSALEFGADYICKPKEETAD